jgi:endonuclease-8
MPEGPSIVILKEQAASFAGHTIVRVEGNSRIDQSRLLGQKVIAFRSWGKHFLVCCPTITLRVHFLLFGSYRINERKDSAPRLSLGFDSGEINLYACSLKYIEGDLDAVYDWSADVMSNAWDPAAARRKLKVHPDRLACDALLDQNVFAGVGNIIKNEVLFRIRVSPESRIGALTPRKLGELIREARQYSFDFLAWKKAFVLRKHYQVHTKTLCPRCGRRLEYRAHLGATQRRAFFCGVCQKRYS